MERWAQVKDWPRYEVSDLGRVRAICGVGRGNMKPLPTPLVVKTQRNKNGYFYAMLYQSGKKRNIQVNRLVLEAFIGPGKGLHAAHENGDQKNNELSNLSWKTAAQNNQQKKGHGTLLYGERIKSSKITEANALKVKELLRRKIAVQVIACIFEVSSSIIQRIKRGETWKHLS